MSYIDEIGTESDQYLDGTSAIDQAQANQDQAQANQDYDRIYQTVATDQLRQLIGAALISLGKPQLLEPLRNSINVMNPRQRAEFLHQLFDLLKQSGDDEKKLLATLGMDQTITINPSEVSVGEILRLLIHIQQHSPTLFNHTLAYYAGHPELVKALGPVAIAEIIRHL